MPRHIKTAARAGTLDEVAYFASPDAGLVTGSSLPADGGWTAW